MRDSVGGIVKEEVRKSRKGRIDIGGDGRIWEDMAREVGRRVQSNSEVRRVCFEGCRGRSSGQCW